MAIGDGNVLRDCLKPLPVEKPRLTWRKGLSIAGDMAVMAIGVFVIGVILWSLAGCVSAMMLG